jgi:hypothetical protein
MVHTITCPHYGQLSYAHAIANAVKEPQQKKVRKSPDNKPNNVTLVGHSVKKPQKIQWLYQMVNSASSLNSTILHQ